MTSRVPFGGYGAVGSGCGGDTSQVQSNQEAVLMQKCVVGEPEKPEVLLANVLKKDLGIDVHPQALRMFLRWRWDRVETLAHKIHD